MNKHSFRLAMLFSVGIFLLLSITMFFSGFIVILMFRTGLIQSQRREIPIISFALVSTVLGSMMARGGRRWVLSPILEISEATKEVAKGNFNIKLKTESYASEVNIMARNFMIMTQELANIETFRNDFINNVSHEFKTPISAIEGYATLLQNKNLSEEKREAYIAKILYNSKRLTSLTGNILQLSRLENQEIPAEYNHFSLDEQIRQIVLMFEVDWVKKSLELDIDLETADYIGNEDLLSQVWQNLIGNAIKFVADKGKIRVILRRQSDYIRIYVSDNGAGMDSVTRQRIFEKFYQGDTSHSVEGNGLGLTLAKRIVDLHGGTIDVSSEEGEGTTFTVTLPYVQEGASQR